MKYLLLVVFVLALFGCDYAQAQDQRLVRCLIGESEKKADMVATAEAMLNRIESMGYERALKAVYGCKAIEKRGAKLFRGDREILPWVIRNAEKALVQARTSNLVGGADHWENVEAFGKPYWADSMTKTAKVGSHTFYKRRVYVW